MIISLIAAASDNNVIGADNTLIWKLADDTSFFMRTTREHTVIMGRRTFDSMGKPLKNRRNIVISRKENLLINGTEVFKNLEDALESVIHADDSDPFKKNELFIIGGEEIYKLAMPFANRIYLTRVHATVKGDAHFPLIDNTLWEEKSRRNHDADERNEYDATYLIYERISR